MSNYIFTLVLDNIVWLLLVIPGYFIAQFYRVITISYFLFKNNRSGYGAGHSKHYADRLFEIDNEIKKSCLVRYGVSRYDFWTLWTTCIEADNNLINKKLVVRDHDNSVKLNKENLYLRFGNFIILKTFKLISKKIYLDNESYFFQ